MITAVFFPSLMGVGIIVSGALLISDWMRRLFPQSRLRRQHSVVVGTYGAIADAIGAAGYRLVEPRFLNREPRPRRTYLAAAVFFGLVANASLQGGLAFYNDGRGIFFRNPWAIGIGYGVAAAALAVAIVCLFLAIWHRPLPRTLQRLVETTSFGRYVLPSGSDQVAALANIERKH